MASRKKHAVSAGGAAPDLAILGDSLTLHPASATSKDLPALPSNSTTSPDQPLLESYARFRSAPLDALREISLQFFGSGWRSYERVVGQPVFYSGYSERMKSMVLQSPILRARITELANKRVQEEADTLGSDSANRRRRKQQIEEQLTEVSELWTDQMICKMESKSFIRGAYYLATQLLTRAYHQGIHVNSEEVLHLRSVAEEAAKKKQSIIFLPCHRSHVDYVSLQLICYRLGLTLPIVVAGDNLNFPLVGPFLQHAGAMWIRRSFGEDALYSTLVQSYMDTLLQNGYNMECFIEGGRSRTGKLLPPKFGILSFMLESLLSGRVKDCLICPVSTQYDKVIEVDSYISELLGQPKEKESLAAFLNSSSILSLKLGRVDVRFHQPWSLRQFIDDQTTRIQSTQSVQISYDNNLKRKLLNVLGYEVLAHINDASVVMPTALIGTVLLTLRGRGVGKAELVRRVEWLCDKVRSRGGRVLHFGNYSTAEVIDRGLEVLGPKMVGKVEGLVEPTFFAVDRFQLSFYRNMTIHLFVSEALVCAALYTKVKLGGGLEAQQMTYEEMYDYVYFLSQLFRGEFIFSSTSLAENLNTTLTKLEGDGIFAVSRSDNGSVASIQLSEAERFSGRENFDFYCFLIWPFIEASWLGTVSILMLTPPQSSIGQGGVVGSDQWVDLRQVQNYAQLLGKTLYHQGDLSYFEAVNKESLSKGYARVEEEGVLTVVRSKDSKVPPRVRLDDSWAPSRDSNGRLVVEGSKLWELCERISLSRREGKNRRDGATVQNRVMGLVEVVGEQLWAKARLPVVDGAQVEIGEKPRQSRRKLQTRAKI
ncbi:acyltransferase-domain-containing protein [Myriangium duriaei CBS 260.36]|uniref:Acyltransferase-domain-containing protein n=1 Tax=Myriangium duriaei CBS 260.36 TaxID=1168546 RepID=A0A9P4IS60_9PEZI|nr:acyltransferase-domain-containing protein [Myriangium duriaei CBS 260.36]